jgi:hypothetical protein
MKHRKHKAHKAHKARKAHKTRGRHAAFRIHQARRRMGRDAGAGRGHKRPSHTQAEWITSLKWNIKDAREALHNAADMSDWAGVEKYAGQLRRLERKLAAAGGKGWRRLQRENPHMHMSLSEWHKQHEASERQRRKGRSGPP